MDRCPELAGLWMECKRHRVAEPAREHAVVLPLRVVFVDGRPARIRPGRGVRRRPDGDVHPLVVGSEDEVAGPMIEAARPTDVDAESLGGIAIERVAAHG